MREFARKHRSVFRRDKGQWFGGERLCFVGEASKPGMHMIIEMVETRGWGWGWGQRANKIALEKKGEGFVERRGC